MEATNGATRTGVVSESDRKNKAWMPWKRELRWLYIRLGGHRVMLLQEPWLKASLTSWKLRGGNYLC